MHQLCEHSAELRIDASQIYWIVSAEFRSEQAASFLKALHFPELLNRTKVAQEA